MSSPPEPEREPRLNDLGPLVRSLLSAHRTHDAKPLVTVPPRLVAMAPESLRRLLQPDTRPVPRRRGALLWLLPLPLLPAALIALGAGELQAFAAKATGLALFLWAAGLTWRGLRSDDLVHRPRFRRHWRWSRKTLGGILLALATAITAYFGAKHGPGISLAFGAVAALGFHLAYGFDPLGGRPPAGAGDAASRRVIEALAEAEGRLLDLEQTAASLTNPELKARLERLGIQGRGILDQIATRPTDLWRARKFLNVYLEGVQQVAAGYARTHRQAESRELEQNFRNVLITVEDVFAEQHQKLLETDVLDLDIQIEVLKKQLQQEGIA